VAESILQYISPLHLHAAAGSTCILPSVPPLLLLLLELCVSFAHLCILQKGVNVINYSNRDGVNSNAVGVSGAAGNRSVELFAVPAPTTGSSAASKLLVGPRQFLSAAPAAAVVQRLGAPNGNYRVVAAGACRADGDQLVL
jgi:hypothetical protein